ncbi:MAG TPA: M23 family metallopeptidase [Gemmatimonadaceae bacterium]|nr:M23 family metallopeptidase [Gemmatimonadaceae bacterium]
MESPANTQLRPAGNAGSVKGRSPFTGPLFALCLSVLVAAGAPAAFAQTSISFPPFLEMRVPKPPTVAASEKGPLLVYEVHVTNFTPQPVTLKKLEVMSSPDKRDLFTLSDSGLMRAVSRPGMAPAGQAERLKVNGGMRAVVFLWVPLMGAAPKSIQHRLTIESGTGDSVRTQTLDGAVVPVTAQAVAIGPPLRGGTWLAANGPSATSGHRRTIIPINGTPAVAQRFAIDWVKVSDDDKTFKGDSLKNESYFAEGVDALAVANGTVVEVKDSIPENVPGINSRAVPITLETVGGNHVIIDIGGGYYAFYAHLRPGSLKVKLGDKVTRGQVVGHVGNTGNSTEPHLHFHLADANSPLGSEGVPYRMDFEVVGHCDMASGACQRSAPVARKGEVPLENALVRFP